MLQQIYNKSIQGCSISSETCLCDEIHKYILKKDGHLILLTNSFVHSLDMNKQEDSYRMQPFFLKQEILSLSGLVPMVQSK